jgi:transketolase
MADIFTALYFHILKHDPGNPDWDERDIVILSNGHIVPIRYVTMAHAGYFPKNELMTLRKFGSRLQGHPERTRLPGMETTSGPLGSGLSQALGMALVLQREDNRQRRVYCLMGDGETNEGQNWEAIMFGAKYRLPITAIVDRNNIQIDGPTETIMPLEDFSAKWESFGWHVLEIDGHNMQDIISACDEAKAIVEKPVVIIAHTIPGKGVEYMEYDYRWHGMPPGSKDLPGDPPKAQQAHEALKQLRTLGGKIRSEHE